LQKLGVGGAANWGEVSDPVDQFNRARTIAEKETILSK